MNDLTAAADSIPKDRPVVFYCRSGNRSAMAAEAFRPGRLRRPQPRRGLMAWVDAESPLEPEDGTVAEREADLMEAPSSTPRRSPAAPTTPATARTTPRRRTPSTSDRGLRAWVAQLDRKLGIAHLCARRRDRAGARGRHRRDRPGARGQGRQRHEGRPGDLRDEVAGVERSGIAGRRRTTSPASATGSANSRRSSQQLRADQTATDQEISVIQDDITDLRDDVSDPRVRGHEQRGHRRRSRERHRAPRPPTRACARPWSGG